MISSWTALAAFACLALASIAFAHVIAGDRLRRLLAHTAIASSVAAGALTIDLAMHANFDEKAVAQAIPVRDCPDCPEMTIVPGGDVDIQVDGVILRQRIWPEFAMSRQEVSAAEYDAFLRHTGRSASVCAVPPDVSASQRAVCISRADAMAYAGWLTQLTGQAYRLATATEWAHALALDGHAPLLPRTVNKVAGLRDATADMLDDCGGTCAAAAQPSYTSLADAPDGRTGMRIVRDIKYSLH